MSRRDRWLAWLGGFLLLTLHLNFEGDLVPWPPRGTELLFGWLPGELAYRLGWVLLVWVYLLFVCAVYRPERSGKSAES